MHIHFCEEEITTSSGPLLAFICKYC